MYQTLSHFAQTVGMVLFVIAFLLVLVYALAPVNKSKFRHASEIPLHDEDDGDGS